VIKWLGNWSDFIRFRGPLQPQNTVWKTGGEQPPCVAQQADCGKRLHPGYNMEKRLNIPRILPQNHKKHNMLTTTIMNKVNRP
jgi:hypothetical protein